MAEQVTTLIAPRARKAFDVPGALLLKRRFPRCGMFRRFFGAIAAAGLVLMAPASARAQIAPPQSLDPGATYEVGFSPGPSAEALVLKTIESARSSILCAAYDFSSRELARALIRKAAEGVAVSIVADAREARYRYSDLRELARSGIAVRLDSEYAAMHDKFMIIDHRNVETGSFNYSYSAASRNAENVIVIWNAPHLAASFIDEWEFLWHQSIPLPAG